MEISERPKENSQALKPGEAMQMLSLLGRNRVGGNIEASEHKGTQVCGVREKTHRSVSAINGLKDK